MNSARFWTIKDPLRRQKKHQRPGAKRKRTFRPGVELLENRITPTFYMVNSSLDYVANDGQLTLREAITAANTNAASGDAIAGSSAAADHIAFHPNLRGKPIKLTGNQLDISGDLRIEGYAPDPITIDAQANSRHFAIDDGDANATIHVTIEGLRLVNGRVTGSQYGGAIRVANNENVFLTDAQLFANTSERGGGGIAVEGSTLAIQNSTFSGNSARDGGGIFVTNSTLNLENTTVIGNSAVDGAGLHVRESSTVTANNSSIDGNSATNKGGGIYGHVFNRVTVTNTILNDNFANSNGGGIHVAVGTLTVENSIVSGNHADLKGAGIYAVNGIVTIEKSIVSSNSADKDGGGMYTFSGTLTVKESTFEENTAEHGGGIVFDRFGTATVTNSNFNGNTANKGSAINRGGGISVTDGSALTVDNSTFEDNVADFGGGITVDQSTITVAHSTFDGNVATLDGGGIYAFGSGSTLTVDNSKLIGNSAGVAGGALRTVSNITATVANSIISSNFAVTGGGIYASHGGSLTVENSLISDNIAAGHTGGGIAAHSSTFTLDNSTVTGNSAGRWGGGIVNGANGTIRNSTIAFNSADISGGGIIHGNPLNDISLDIENSIVAGNSAPADPDLFGFSAESIFNVDYSLIQNTAGSNINETTPGSNIFGQDPLLRPLADNGGPTLTHDLVEFSPAINAGDPNFIPPPGSDQRGFPRIVNRRTDMGAVEHGAELRLFAGLLGDNRIVLFDADDPSNIEKTVTVTGLDENDKLIGIDVRPEDGKLYGVGKRNRIYRINLTTGQATRTAAMTVGLSDGEAMTFDENLGLTDKILGLYRDSNGYYQGWFGSQAKWVRGEDNQFGNPWYFIEPDGDFYAWDGEQSSTGELLHSFGTNVFIVPELLVHASQAQLPLDQQDDAKAIDENLGLYVAAAGAYEDLFSADAKWLRGVNNSFGNPWYIIKSNGEFLRWNGQQSATGNVLFNFDPLLFRHPELLYEASQAQLPAAEQDDAQQLDETFGLYVDSGGYYQGGNGAGFKWLRGKTNQFGSPWYYIDSQGKFFAVNPSGAHNQLFDFHQLLFWNPELLHEASQLQLSAGEKAQAETFDRTFGLYVDKNNYYESTGGPKWLRGEPNSFGHVWYLVRPTGEFVEWNGTGTDGNVLHTFDPVVFLHPQLIHDAFQPVLSPNYFGDTTEAGVDFDPVDGLLRIVTDNGQNLHVDVDTGETTAHGQLQDAGGGVPDIIAAAYSNNLAGAAIAELFNIGATRDVLTRQDPEDDGTNNTVGSLGVDAGPTGGFDILGEDLGYAALGNGSSRLYAVDLSTGSAKDLGEIGDDLMIYSLAALSPQIYAAVNGN